MKTVEAIMALITELEGIQAEIEDGRLGEAEDQLCSQIGTVETIRDLLLVEIEQAEGYNPNEEFSYENNHI